MAAVAIDFGTHFARLAVFDRRRQIPIVRAMIPAVAYIPRFGPVLVGQAAVDAITLDPGGSTGAIDDLKRRIGADAYLRNRRMFHPVELIQLMFTELRQLALGVRETCDPLIECTIAVPLQFESRKCELLADAARAAGFSRVSKVDDLVAAARYCENGQQVLGNAVAVCDLGHSCQVAVLRKLDGSWRADLEILPPLPIARTDNGLPRLLIDAIRRISSDLSRCGLNQIPLLVVGGGASISGIEATIKAEGWAGEVIVPPEPDLAVVLGAVSGPPKDERADSLRCPQCQFYPVPKKQRACPDCGFQMQKSLPRDSGAQVRDSRQMVNCSVCQFEVSPDVKTCPNCGVELSNRAAAPASLDWISRDGCLTLADYHLPDLSSIVSNCLSAFRSGKVTRLQLIGEDWQDQHVREICDLLCGGETFMQADSVEQLKRSRIAHPGLETIEITSGRQLTAAAIVDLTCLCTLRRVNLSMWRVRESAVDGIQQLARLPLLQTINLPASLEELPSRGGKSRRELLGRYFEECNPEISVC